ncbi:MAG TPA: hypothetical protein VL096_16880 [Pirellulaceae bacterium]|nr:hypothetical protein [Pirellulaceae bacterium]
MSRLAVLLIINSAWLLCINTLALADGGTVRAMESNATSTITVFSSPTPFRAGPVDTSVLVQDQASGDVIEAATITVVAQPRDRRGPPLRVRASRDAATNKLLQAALFDLPHAGWWKLQVTVERDQQPPQQLSLELEASEPPPRWLTFWPWFCWPLLAITLFGIHQRLARRTPTLSAKD